MEIERLYNRDTLSLRAYNVCCENGFISVADLKAYCKLNGNFMNLAKVGPRTNEELIEVTNRFSDSIKAAKDDELIESDFLNIISRLNDSELELLNHFIDDLRSRLRNRSRNAITQYLKRDFGIKTLATELIVQPIAKIQNIPNVGSLTLQEILDFIIEVKNYVHQIDANTDRHLVTQKNTSLFIQKSFSIKHIPLEVLEPVSVFRILDFLITNDYFLPKNYNAVFTLKYCIYNNSKCYPNEAVANKIGVTKERVRQINKRLLKKIQTNLEFVEKVADQSIADFTSDADYYYISDSDAEIINVHAGTDFSTAFIAFILGLILQNHFDTVGDLDDVLGDRTYSVRQRHVWKRMYLINKSISKIVDFEEMINDLNKRLNVRIEKTYFIQMESYIAKFVCERHADTDLNAILAVCEVLLKNEMGIDISGSNKIEIRRNSYKRIDEYAYEILELIGEPTSAEIITEKINGVFKDRDISVTSVRVLMTVDKGFVYIGREGVYGLKKWESERKNFKGGTIRSITAEYLVKHDEPMLIDDIVGHVLIFRPNSNKESITQNLRLEPYGKFVFYEGNRVGFRDKAYDDIFKKKR